MRRGENLYDKNEITAFYKKSLLFSIKKLQATVIDPANEKIIAAKLKISTTNN